MSYKLIDISKDLRTAPVYPGDPKPGVSVFSSIAAGDACNMALLTTTLHAGTHADAPLHFLRTGADIASLPLDPFIGECTVFEPEERVLTGQYVDQCFPRVERLLLKSRGKSYFDRTGAEEAAYLGIKLIGTDGMSVGCETDEIGPHRALLDEGVAILENLDLTDVAPGRYFLLAQPVKIAGMDGAPVRAVLLDGYLFWSK
ncbi:MAG: cyclase family protein [Clostridia bacterium]|nr:cyclase family protein [Clostridia bacterium]